MDPNVRSISHRQQPTTGMREFGGTGGPSVPGSRILCAVVTQEKIEVAGVVPVRVTCEGDNVALQHAFRVTVPVNPLTGVTVIVLVAVCPAVMLMLVGLADSLKSVTVTFNTADVDGA